MNEVNSYIPKYSLDKPILSAEKPAFFSAKFKKTLFVIFGLTIFLGLGYGIYTLFFNKVKQAECVDEQFGYKFFYPQETWHKASKEEMDEINIKKTENDLKIQEAIVKNEEEETVFGMIVQEAPGAKTFSRDKSIAIMDEQNKVRHNSFKKISSEKIDFLGFPAIDYKIEYGFMRQIRSQEELRRERQIIFLANEKIYRIVFASLPENYKENQKDFNQILKSFSLLN